MASPAPYEASRRRRVRRFLAAGIVALEAFALVLATGWSIVDAVARSAGSGAVAFTAICLIGAVWLAATAFALARRRAWARGSAVVAQILLLAVAVGAFQGIFARPDIGWALLAVALAALVLLFTADLRDPEPEPDAASAPDGGPSDA